MKKQEEQQGKKQVKDEKEFAVFQVDKNFYNIIKDGKKTANSFSSLTCFLPCWFSCSFILLDQIDLGYSCHQLSKVRPTSYLEISYLLSSLCFLFGVLEVNRGSK